MADQDSNVPAAASDGGTPVIPLPNTGEGGPVADGGVPVIPLPKPGEGGPVADGGVPVIPLPNPGEGGPVADGGVPVIPLPNPGEGGPVADGGVPVVPLPNPGEGGPLPTWPAASSARFLHAAYGYPPFRIQVDRIRAVNWLEYGSVSSYRRIAAGYHTVTVTGTDGYIYIQKTMPFQAGIPTTIAVINTAGGLDLLQIVDSCCPPGGGFSNFRVSNLARNSTPLDVLLADGRVVYADVRFKETTPFKRIRPGEYQFFFADTSLTPMPAWLDIETLDSAFLGTYLEPNTVTALYLNIVPGANYTVFLLSSGTASNAVQTLTVTDR